MNKQTEALKLALVDEDGENRAVRWFLAAYRNPGMSVGGMKAHLKLSGYPLWPDWVERCHPSEHLTKAGAQLWIRHLFSLEATPPAAPVQEPTVLWHLSKDGLPPVGSEVIGGFFGKDTWLKGEPEVFYWGKCGVMAENHRDFPDGKRWITFGPSHNQITHWCWPPHKPGDTTPPAAPKKGN